MSEVTVDFVREADVLVFADVKVAVCRIRTCAFFVCAMTRRHH